MAIIRWRPSTEVWDPFANLAEIQEEMNRLFDTSLHKHGGTEGAFLPALDVVEEKDSLIVKADLPGMSKDDIKVAIQDNVLTVKGERKYEAEKKEANFYRQERIFGSFVRSIELPVSVDSGKVLATFRDGVLHVTLPKAENAKPKEIQVSVS